MDFTDTYSEQLFEVKASNKDGVLAVATGPHFFPGEVSRNKRIYPYEAWTKALANPYTTRLLENKLMFGTVGHADLDFDELIRESKVSHRITRLWMEERNGKTIGIGEAEILDTPVGRILHTIMKTGSKMAVSSKSYGEYSSKDESGNQIVDSAKFFCQRFDFVVDPGFLNAQPQLREAYEEAISSKKIEENKIEDIKQEDSEMDEKLIKAIEEKAKMEVQLGEALAENAKLRKLREEAEEASIEDIKKELEDLKQENADLKAKLAAYEEKGSPDDIEDAFQNTVKFMKFVERFGGASNIQRTFSNSEKLTSTLEEMGSPALIQDTLKKASILIEELEPYGTLADIKMTIANAERLTEELEQIGSIPKIKEALGKAQKMMEASKAKVMKENVDALVASYGVSEEDAKALVKDVGIDKAKSVLKGLKEKLEPSNHYRKEMKEDVKTTKDSTALEGTRTGRLFESFNK